jgi:hypothetical protein
VSGVWEEKHAKDMPTIKTGAAQREARRAAPGVM